MKTGIILNSFSVSKDRKYLWDTVAETVNHYKEKMPNVKIISCSSGVENDNDIGTYESYIYRGSTRESMHNTPVLIRRAINDFQALKCEKLLFVSPYYRIHNFDFLDADTKLGLLIDKNEYPSDFIKNRSISFNFFYVATDFMIKAWEKHPWNYNIANPSENLFQKINNLVGTKKILNSATFLTKSDLSIEELKVFWKSNIKYTRH